MGSPDSCRPHWAGILLSASLLTAWSVPAAAQLALNASLLNISRKFLAKPTISVSQGTVTEGKETVTFCCNTKDVNVTIYWVFNHQPMLLHEHMELSPDRRMLTILSVLRGDYGSYQCEAWQDHRAQSSDPTYLVVNYGPDPFEIKVESGVPRGEVVGVTEGSNVTFSVETQSCPLPAYFWFLPNESTPSFTTRTFTIHAVSREHEGTYRCLANNSATQLSHLASLKLQVLEHPTKPLVVTPRLNVVENARAMPLTCQTTREGAPAQWLLRGRPLLPSKHLVLSSGPQSSLSAGSVAGIAIGILTVIALSAGLGCFLHSRNARWYPRNTAEDPTHEVTTPTSKEEHPAPPSAGSPRPVYANILELQDQVRVKKTLSEEPLEQFYEKDLPSATPGGYSHGPRKPSPELVLHPLGSTLPKGNTESIYEVLVNQESSIYCRMKSSI